MLAAFDNNNIPNMYMSTLPWDGDTTTTYDYNSEPMLTVTRTPALVNTYHNSRSYLVNINSKALYCSRTAAETPPPPVLSDPITVAEPALVISPTQMNVFYRGLDNPVAISVPGVPQDKIERIDGGHKLSQT